MTLTIEEAREQLDGATSKYKELETALSESMADETTAERVLRRIELQAALADCARELVESKKSFESISAEAASRRTERAQAQLYEVEAQLVEAVAEAEENVEKFADSLGRVLDLSKKRYAFRQEATGRASRSLLARNSVQGWLAWRLQHLELPGMDNAPHHYRGPLSELLGLEISAIPTSKPGDDK